MMEEGGEELLLLGDLEFFVACGVGVAHGEEADLVNDEVCVEEFFWDLG